MSCARHIRPPVAFTALPTHTYHPRDIVLISLLYRRHVPSSLPSRVCGNRRLRAQNRSTERARRRFAVRYQLHRSIRLLRRLHGLVRSHRLRMTNRQSGCSLIFNLQYESAMHMHERTLPASSARMRAGPMLGGRRADGIPAVQR